MLTLKRFIMKREVITLSTLLTIGITLITMGISFFQSEQYVEGVICVAMGFGLICAGIYLFEKGIIEQFEKITPRIKRKKKWKI